MLTHYTRSTTAVANILTHGFAWIPNRRRLTDLLIPQHDYSEREPQQFGMISFTELAPNQSERHCETFGHFGLTVTEDWAKRHHAQRVIYLDEDGPVTAALCAVFDIGYIDLTQRIQYPDDKGWLMAYENKVMASSIAGATLWANILQLWEYLEPSSCSDQREWRVVNEQPLYSLSQDRAEAIRQVSPPKNWAKHMSVIRIDPSDLTSLACRHADRQILLECLPSEFKHLPLVTTGA